MGLPGLKQQDVSHLFDTIVGVLDFFATRRSSICWFSSSGTPISNNVVLPSRGRDPGPQDKYVALVSKATFL